MNVESVILWQSWMKRCYAYQLLLCSLLKSHWNPEVLDKVVTFLRCCLEIVLLNTVTHVVNYNYLEFTLHLSYCQLFVHSFLLSCDQYLRNMNSKEDFWKALEPTHPILLSLFEINFPSKVLVSIFLKFHHLTRKGYSSWFQFSDCTRVIAPLDSIMESIKMFWSISNDLIHEGKSFYCSSFNNIDNYSSRNALQFLYVC